MNGPRWTPDETRTLLDNYRRCSIEQLAEMIPTRTPSAIYHMAGSMGLLDRTQPHVTRKVSWRQPDYQAIVAQTRRQIEEEMASDVRLG